jgi:hypothetical protein
MGTFLEFDELPVGAQVMLATQSGGNVIGKAVPAGGGGASERFQLVTVPDDLDLVFSGAGGAAITIYPQTIISCRTVETPRNWKLLNAGAEQGWIVAMNIEGVDPGAVSIRDDADVLLATISVTNPTGALNAHPFPMFFFDPIDGWLLLRSRILTPT